MAQTPSGGDGGEPTTPRTPEQLGPDGTIAPDEGGQATPPRGVEMPGTQPEPTSPDQIGTNPYGARDGFGQVSEPGQPQAGYAAAPPPGQQDLSRPSFGMPQPVPSTPGGPGGRSGSSTGVIIAAVLGGLVLLAAIVGGAWLLFGNDEGAETGTGTDGGSAIPTPTDPPTTEPATGCTNDLCTQTAELVGDTHIGEDGVAWAVDGSWTDVESGSSDALGAGTGEYGSEEGTATLTVVGFETADQAADYAEQVMADLGEPYSTGAVWDGAQPGRGEGVLNRFSEDGTETVVWYDDSGVVCSLVGGEGASRDTIFAFYYTLPPI